MKALIRTAARLQVPATGGGGSRLQRGFCSSLSPTGMMLLLLACAGCSPPAEDSASRPSWADSTLPDAAIDGGSIEDDCLQDSVDDTHDGNSPEAEGLHPCLDADGDGYGLGLGCRGPDCDDNNSGRHPFAPEVCGNQIDDDCDGVVDEDCEQPCRDPDGDRFGDGIACWGQDCAPEDPEVHTGLLEICGNGKDDDCDGETDEDCPDGCLDKDGDGFGLGRGCAGPDCDDGDGLTSPEAQEACGDGKDNDCDGRVDEDCPPPCIDPDGDGYGVGPACKGPDCDEATAAANPGQPELCGNSKDDDCDGETDEGCPVSPPCADFAACTAACPENSGDCEDGCWTGATDACRRCTLDAWSTCNSTWCPAEVAAFRGCRQRNGCEDLRWDENLDNCTTRSCSQDARSLAVCWSTNSGSILEDYDRVCEPLYGECDGAADPVD